MRKYIVRGGVLFYDGEMVPVSPTTVSAVFVEQEQDPTEWEGRALPADIVNAILGAESDRATRQLTRHLRR